MDECKHLTENKSGTETNPQTGHECIILAGGLGTRLKDAVPGLPKSMAPVAGKPFLQYLINYLLAQGVKRFVFSLGHMHELICTFLEENYSSLNYSIVIEPVPLGTGGAVRLASSKATQENVLVLNGDTMFAVDVTGLLAYHTEHHCACTLSLKPMQDFDRYGVVELGMDNSIRSFEEKKQYQYGLINGGVYVLNVPGFMALPFPDKFSFEKDYLEVYHDSETMKGFIQDGYFIDIGIPEDYERAGRELELLFKGNA
jgi:D-glycero-alpha-D-manno-heptose 1-phosphate guanylyltransferase